jgi:hypothetical protein
LSQAAAKKPAPMNTLDDYTDWLRTQKYTDSTIEASLKVLRRLDHAKPDPRNLTDRFLLRRYLRYVKETRRNPLGRTFTEALSQLGLEPAVPRAVPGKRKRKLLTVTEFHVLKDRCLRSEDVATVLVGFYMMSGKKPHDFLQQKTLIRDNAAVFKVRQDILLSRPVVYENLSTSLSWAYRTLLAAAKKQGEALGLDVDLDILYRSRLQLR